VRVARRALPLFSQAPPTGVRRRTRGGPWYLLYSYAPGQLVLNGFLQSLIGLYDLGRIGRVPLALRLFRAGDRTARRAVPRYDTGSWSLYEPGEVADVNYHVLVRDFLQRLCDRTSAHVYCATARRFTADLRRRGLSTAPRG